MNKRTEEALTELVTGLAVVVGKNVKSNIPITYLLGKLEQALYLESKESDRQARQKGGVMKSKERRS